MASRWVQTDESFRMLSASDAAAALFNHTTRGLRGRSLLLFFPADRTQLQRESVLAQLGGESRSLAATLRPRDRKPVAVTVMLTVPAEGAIRWELSAPAPPQRTADSDGFERQVLAAEGRALREARAALHVRVNELGRDRRPEVVTELAHDLRDYSARLNAFRARLEDLRARDGEASGAETG